MTLEFTYEGRKYLLPPGVVTPLRATLRDTAEVVAFTWSGTDPPEIIGVNPVYGVPAPYKDQNTSNMTVQAVVDMYARWFSDGVTAIPFEEEKP